MKMRKREREVTELHPNADCRNCTFCMPDAIEEEIEEWGRSSNMERPYYKGKKRVKVSVCSWFRKKIRNEYRARRCKHYSLYHDNPKLAAFDKSKEYMNITQWGLHT